MLRDCHVSDLASPDMYANHHISSVLHLLDQEILSHLIGLQVFYENSCPDLILKQDIGTHGEHTTVKPKETMRKISVKYI